MDISNDISIIKPFNLSSQTDDDNDYSLLDPEINDIENQSFRPVLEDSLDADPLLASSLLNGLTSAAGKNFFKFHNVLLDSLPIL